MKAEIITIGDELLIGQTVDTNSAFIGSRLSLAGFDVHRKVSVHDKRQDILNALNDTKGKSDVVIITGGLGPTSDDITKPTLCEFFETRLIKNETVYRMVEDMTKRLNFPMTESNKKQAEVPESCKVLTNAVGTAPGMWFEKDGTIYVSLPGVPFEMIYLMNEHVLPELQKRFSSENIIHKNIMVTGISESRLAELLTGFESSLPSHIKLAYLPAFGIIKLRLTGTGPDRKKLSAEIDQQVKNLYETVPELIYGEDEESLEMVIGKLLYSRNKTLCTAESCTGGYIAHLITSVPGSSNYYKGSVVSYSNEIKTDILKVNKEVINSVGAVSEEVVKEMALNSLKLFNADFSIATSGIAGPEGGTENKPVGTLWVAAASRKRVVTEKHTFGKDRIVNIKRFSTIALNLLRKLIINE